MLISLTNYLTKTPEHSKSAYTSNIRVMHFLFAIFSNHVIRDQKINGAAICITFKGLLYYIQQR